MHIYNVDEKVITQNYQTPTVIASADSKPPLIASEKSSTVTVLGCGNALGHQTPPFFVFPGVRKRQELMKGASPGADFEMSESGWSNSGIFQHYLQDHFLKYAVRGGEDQHILLLYDGHRSHISPYLIDWGIENKVILFVLPAHTSHVLQPMDVGCFGPFSKIYSNECHKYQREHLGAVNKLSVCELACKTYTLALSPQNLRAAFKKSGVFPLNPSVLSESDFAPGDYLRQNCEVVEQNAETPSDAATSNVDDQQQSSVNEKFFEEKLKRPVQRAPSQKRRNISSVVAGKAITENDTADNVRAYIETSAKSKYKNQTPKQSTQSRKSTNPKKSSTLSKKSSITTEAVPGTSGYRSRQSVAQMEDSSEESELPIDESDLCCVCRRHEPAELRQCVSLIFVKWGQCDYEGCRHWTHLRFCCNVRVLRRHDNFYCPCHGLPCKQ